MGNFVSRILAIHRQWSFIQILATDHNGTSIQLQTATAADRSATATVQQQRPRLLLQMGKDLKKGTIEKMLFGQSQQGWAARIARKEGRRSAYGALVKETWSREITWKTRCRWEGNNIKTDLTEIGWEGMGWFMWLKIGINGRPFWTGWEIANLDQMRSISRIAKELLASQEGISATELISYSVS